MEIVKIKQLKERTKGVLKALDFAGKCIRISGFVFFLISIAAALMNMDIESIGNYQFLKVYFWVLFSAFSIYTVALMLPIAEARGFCKPSSALSDD